MYDILYAIYIIYIYIVLLLLHTFMCSPDEGHRRTETSYFLIKSLELMCHAYFFTVYIYICIHTGMYIFILKCQL